MLQPARRSTAPAFVIHSFTAAVLFSTALLVLAVCWSESAVVLAANTDAKKPTASQATDAAADREANSNDSKTQDPSRSSDSRSSRREQTDEQRDNTDERPADSQQEPEVPENPFPNRLKLPPGTLDGGTGWLNTSGEIRLADLRGKVVLLDFWTYCCINCMHVLPDLEFLEEKYPNELVVIGVHSAKFDNEKDSDHIRRAVMRYEIEHPVVNDSNMIIWRKFAVRSWPTLALVDPEGYYVGSQSGEGNRELFDSVIASLIEYHTAKGTLDVTPVQFSLEREKLKPSPLKFPGKVLADQRGNRLFIADTNHNRIVVTTLDGELLDVIGSGAMGASDGTYSEANFDHPQGMTLNDQTLYVADTENHLIRAVDLNEKRVATLAGTGRQARGIYGAVLPGALPRQTPLGGKLRETSLNSPWDLVYVDGTLYIAMAGSHQLWHHKIGSDAIEVYAGSGREDILDGPRREAALAQPSAIDTDGEFLFFVDSEGSAVRKVPVGGQGEVTTIVGPSNLPQGRSLFAFGDVDGVGQRVRLQHPIGLAYHDGSLFIADSYNHKIKEVILLTRRTVTLFGDGQSGDSLSPPRYSEPHGLAFAKGMLYVADTNNHRICWADPGTREVGVLEIRGLNPPALAERHQRRDLPFVKREPPAQLEVQRVTAGDDLVIEINFQLPAGYKLNKLAPPTYRLKANGPQKLIANDQLGNRNQARADESTARISVPLAAKFGAVRLHLSLTYGYCRDGVGGLCKIDTARWLIPVEVSADADQELIRLSVGSEK